jgi:glycosyltransferase involved in cell wall biosynthesis
MTVSQGGLRIRIGIIFNFSASWMGGVVYILNLIKTLNHLEDYRKPEIILFYNRELKRFVDEIQYPLLTSLEWEFPPVYSDYFKSWIFRKNYFIEGILNKYELDGLYPVLDLPVKTITKTKLVSWYADLQHKYYPEFFTLRKIVERNFRIKFMLRYTDALVVSSRCTANDFTRFFRLRNSMDLIIYHFVSVMENLDKIKIDEIKIKYGLPHRYYMVSNQFHKHKNHRILFKALSLLKERGIIINLAVTGKLPGAKNSKYLKELHHLIRENYLNNQIYFLGVIPRNEQLVLMKNSEAVIQPSFFEGWSTVIEDAKSLQVPVIASNLPVNKEQLETAGTFFDPNNPHELASVLDNYKSRDFDARYYQNYSERIRKAAEEFIKIFY